MLQKTHFKSCSINTSTNGSGTDFRWRIRWIPKWQSKYHLRLAYFQSFRLGKATKQKSEHSWRFDQIRAFNLRNEVLNHPKNAGILQMLWKWRSNDQIKPVTGKYNRVAPNRAKTSKRDDELASVFAESNWKHVIQNPLVLIINRLKDAVRNARRLKSQRFAGS